jgi:hypothetical protein
MANAFNLMSRKVIFHELCATSGNIIQLFPFVCAFYAFESPTIGITMTLPIGIPMTLPSQLWWLEIQMHFTTTIIVKVMS